MCIFRWQIILTRVSPPSQKTIYNFELVVGHTTKHTKHGRSFDTEIWSSVENVALGLHPHATFSTSGSSYFNVPLTTVHHLYNVIPFNARRIHLGAGLPRRDAITPPASMSSTSVGVFFTAAVSTRRPQLGRVTSSRQRTTRTDRLTVVRAVHQPRQTRIDRRATERRRFSQTDRQHAVQQTWPLSCS